MTTTFPDPITDLAPISAPVPVATTTISAPIPVVESVPVLQALAEEIEVVAGEPAEPEPFTEQHVLPVAWPSLPEKSLRAAYAWSLPLGLVGAHRFYLGSPATGVLYALTGGVFGIGLLVDLVTLPAQVRRLNDLRAMGIV
jgi:hypothetical protein